MSKSKHLQVDTFSKYNLSLNDIAPFFSLRSKEAAIKLDISETYLKKCMRKYGIKRWPRRKFISIEKIIEYGNPDEKADAIHKKELLMSNPNINLRSLISKTRINRINSKIMQITTGRSYYTNKQIHKANALARSKVANKSPNFLNIMNCDTFFLSKTVGKIVECDCDSCSCNGSDSGSNKNEDNACEIECAQILCELQAQPHIL